MTQGRSRSGSRWLLMSQMIFGIPRPGGYRDATTAVGCVYGWRPRMKTKLVIATLAVSILGLAVAGAASGAFVAIYRNALETTAQRSEVLKLSGKACTRGGGQATLNITVGKLTEECAYKT